MSLQMAELQYLLPPSIDALSIAERAESLIESGIECSSKNDQSNALIFLHTGHLVEYAEGRAPAQTAFFVPDRVSDPEQHVEAIQQSWACEDASERIRACSSSGLVTELMASVLQPADRLKLFHGVLQAIVELTKPHAIVFVHSKQVIAPESYLAACNKAPIHRPGSLNVRFFRITNSEGEDMLMDTRGLSEIGLHNLQCHYRNLDPNDVSGVLYNAAIYIAEN